MRKPVVALVAVVALAAAGGGGFFLFERHERGGLAARAERACAGLDDVAPGTPTALPLDLPEPADGGKLLRVAEQGSTVVAFVEVPGDRPDLVDVRDDVLDSLEAQGYEVVGRDQEAGFEAEAEVRGPHEGTVKVTPLCEGELQVRYALSR